MSDESRIDSLRTVLMDNYRSNKNQQKRNAAEFLFQHIGNHYSDDLIWVNQEGEDLGFKELSFPNYLDALKAFQELKDSVKIRPKNIKIPDLELISAFYLKNNIENSFKVWKKYPWSRKYSFETFCEKILPYRSVTEPLQDWREDYAWFLQNVVNNLENTSDQVKVCYQIADKVRQFEFIQMRKDPLPLLGPNQLLFREQGSCPDFANLLVYSGRALGLAMSFDFTPHWAASSSRHMWCSLEKSDGTNVPFDVYEFYTENFNKRLGKVFRYNYALQESSMAAQVPIDSIPVSFLRSENISDVTDLYVDTTILDYKYQNSNSSYGYLSVFNKMSWEIIDWAMKDENGITTFNKIGQNLVYLPLSGSKQIKAEAYPILVKKGGASNILKPSLLDRFSCVLSRNNETRSDHKDNNPFEILENNLHTLYYWNNGWKKIGESKALDQTVSYDKIPKNALYLLAPTIQDKFIRIFTINPTTCTITWY